MMEEFMKRFRFTRDKELRERLIEDARLAKGKAVQLPAGRKRESLLKKAHEANVAGWLSSSALRPPK
jgi:hypothetical protein